MIEKNLPTPFGIFLEANAKPARGCWHELLESGGVIVIVAISDYLKIIHHQALLLMNFVSKFRIIHYF